MGVYTPGSTEKDLDKKPSLPSSILAKGLRSVAGVEFLLDLLKFKGILNDNEISWVNKMSDSYVVVDMTKVKSFSEQKRKDFYDLVAKTSFKEYHEGRFKRLALIGVLKDDEEEKIEEK